MIKNWAKYNEAYSNVISSVVGFMNKVKDEKDLNYLDIFKNDLNHICDVFSIPKSKITGKYLKTKKALEEINKINNEKFIAFWFTIDSYEGFKLYGDDSFEDKNGFNRKLKSTFYNFEKNCDFCILVNIDEQDKGLNDLIKSREDSKDGASFLRTNLQHKTSNIKRYKKQLSVKRLPDLVKSLSKYLNSENFANSRIKVSFLKSILPQFDKDSQIYILNDLLSNGVLSDEEYYKIVYSNFNSWF
jgi:hypothetical protein